jgi:O-antigen ligase
MVDCAAGLVVAVVVVVVVGLAVVMARKKDRARDRGADRVFEHRASVCQQGKQQKRATPWSG